MPKIVVGISGGLDSFVTTLLLCQQGYEVIGVNLRLWPDKDEQKQEELKCLYDKIHIPVFQINGQTCFQQQVVTPFIQGYLSGVTPNPCSICNNRIKWRFLQEFADRQGIKLIATGHYVRIKQTDGHFYVHRGIDSTKDQSYFLWNVPEEILSRAITPLGEYTKTAVREIAKANGFNQLAAKKESMSICFLEGNDYRTFIARKQGVLLNTCPGNIIDSNGHIIGQHNGVMNYTIGQKRGIPLKNGQPQYVARVNTATNELFVGDKATLYQTLLHVQEVHLINPADIHADDITVKIRGLGLNPSGYAHITTQDNRTLHVQLNSPAWAPAPGQPVVFYRQERVIGGGILA